MWNAFVAWFQSPSGQRVIDGAVVPAVAIIVAGIIAALIARGAVRSVLARAEREAVAGAVAAVVEVARSLAAGPDDMAERERIARLRSEADVRLRLAPPSGAPLAAEWASLRLDSIQRDASGPVRQAHADADEVRERLVAWVARPRRAKRLFASDVERLRAERTARRSNVREEPVTAAPAVDRAEGSAPTEAQRQPEPVSARAQNAAHEQAERERTAEQPAEQAPEQAEAQPASPTTEPVLIARTRLESMDRTMAERADHARHARPEEAGAPSAPPVAAAPGPEEAPASQVPERPEAQPVPQAPQGQPQPTPAWLDTYDDEADVTQDIDLSKTPRPVAASAVRDRTRTGDDIVPRH
ncbi:MAG: hypothetical protein ACTHJL_03430 [Amnibacterium sp.]